MEELLFFCRIITPMSMAGSDPQKPELRPSEFKGLMRFWWRAIKSETDIKKLREEENKIFGGTGDKEGKSKVLIRVKGKELRTERYWLLPHKRKAHIECFSPGGKFKVELKLVDSEIANPEEIKSLFLLSTILGGFGKRSRRGFGSIMVEKIKMQDEEETPKEISLNLICELLNKIESSYQIRNGKITNKKEGGSYPWIREIEIGRTHYGTYRELLKKIGQASHTHRDSSLGDAKPRMASPVYVSIIKDNKGFRPIIVTLHSAFPHRYFKKQEEFKQEILI
jgi:CRISPR-associated protein Cmr1